MADDLDQYLSAVLIGGLEPGAIVLADYDPAWRARYDREAATISEALGDRVREVKHIGSTAVPGLAAKPIIDILVVVQDSSQEAAYIPALEGAGYVLRVREPGFHEHRMLRTPARDVHVHVYSTGSPEIDRQLRFRDRLRTSEADRLEYARTKRDLASRDWKSMQYCAEAKTAVIERIMARGDCAAAVMTGPRVRAGASAAARPWRHSLGRRASWQGWSHGPRPARARGATHGRRGQRS